MLPVLEKAFRRIKRDVGRSWLEKSIEQHRAPETVTIDTNGAKLAALDALNEEREIPLKFRQNKYLNSFAEQDHRAIMSGSEPTPMIVKGQLEDDGVRYTHAQQFYPCLPKQLCLYCSLFAILSLRRQNCPYPLNCPTLATQNSLSSYADYYLAALEVCL